MIYITKSALALFVIGWAIFGVWLVFNYEVLFGWKRDDPSETAGARSFGVTHIGLVWFGFFALAVYFLLR